MTETTSPFYRQLHWQIAIGLFAGLGFALITRALFLVPNVPTTSAQTAIHAAINHADSVAFLDQIRAPFGFVGDLFIRLLKLIVIPLILFSVLTGIQKLGTAGELGRVGLRTMG